MKVGMGQKTVEENFSAGESTINKKYLIYFIHDLHGYIEGVPARPHIGRPNMHGPKKPKYQRVGGIKAIAETLKDVINSQKHNEQADYAFVCLGGDMVAEYRSRILSEENVVQVWEYILKEIGADVWIFGNHELDAEYQHRLCSMIKVSPQTGCTRNLVWCHPSLASSLVTSSCPHQGCRIPSCSVHFVDNNHPIVFTGLTEPGAGLKKDGAGKGVVDYFSFQLEDVETNVGWAKVCGQIKEGWRQEDNNVFKLMRQSMDEDLKGDIQSGIPNDYKQKLLNFFNCILKNERFYWDNKELLSKIVENHQFPKEAKDLIKKTAGSLTVSETACLNMNLLRYAFKPPLSQTLRYMFHILDPEKLAKDLQKKPIAEGCPRYLDSVIHIHIAHVKSMTPTDFGKKGGGPWDPDESDNGRPDIILKAHDHTCSSSRTDEIYRRGYGTNNGWIPTFEAGRNGTKIGRLVLTILKDKIKYKWSTFSPLGAQGMNDSDLKRIGITNFESVQKYLPQIPIQFGRMGGSPFDSNELFRAVTLLLRSMKKLCKTDEQRRTCFMMSPSLIVTDAYVPGDDREAGDSIDLFDIGHLFGHSEIINLITIDNQKELVDGIMKGLKCVRLGVNILPSISGSVEDPEIQTWRDLTEFWHHEFGTWPANMKVGRAICIRLDTCEYLIVSSATPSAEKPDISEIRVYELQQTGSARLPEYSRSFVSNDLVGFLSNLKIQFPLEVYLNGFLGRCSDWEKKVDCTQGLGLIRVVEEYIKYCSTLKREFWELS